MPEQPASQVKTSSVTDADLSPASVALIERFLQRRPKPERPDDSPNIRAIIAYLMGEASPAETYATELCLVRDSAARGLHRRVDKAVELLRRLAWEDVVQIAAGESSNVENVDIAVAQIWQQRLARQMKVKPVSLARYLNDFGGWSGANGDESMRDSDQALAWSTMNAVLQQSLRPSSSRPAFAVVRSGANLAGDLGDGIHVVGLPSRYQTVVVQTAEITGRGDLQVKVELRLAAGYRSAASRRGERIRLEMTACGRDWLLDEAEVIGNYIEWRIPNIGAATGIEPGPLDLSRLTLKFGRASRQRSASDLSEPSVRHSIPETLVATILGANGEPGRAGSEVTLTMPTVPTFRADRLHLTIGMPVAVRLARAAYRLNFDLLVTPERAQRLGSFPVSRWAKDGAARVLEIPWPGATTSRANADLVLALLQISLQAGAGSSAENPET